MVAAEAAVATVPRSPSAGRAGRSMLARDALARAAERARPVALAGERALPVVPALAGLLPEGLRRGTTVAVEPGPGATSLALALAAGASAAGSWVAIVGAPSLGLAAAVELGLAPERLLVVAGAGPGAPGTATAVAALVDAVDVVLVGERVAAADGRRLSARARERGAVLVALPGRWPQPGDLRLRVAGAEWSQPQRRLAARRVEVVAEGRGSAARRRQAALWLPGPDGAVALAGPLAAEGAIEPVARRGLGA